MTATGQERKCLRCERTMVAITLEIADEPRTLFSCSHCDVREWEHEGSRASLAGVLDDLAKASGRS